MMNFSEGWLKHEQIFLTVVDLYGIGQLNYLFIFCLSQIDQMDLDSSDSTNAPIQYNTAIMNIVTRKLIETIQKFGGRILSGLEKIAESLEKCTTAMKAAAVAIKEGISHNTIASQTIRELVKEASSLPEQLNQFKVRLEEDELKESTIKHSKSNPSENGAATLQILESNSNDSLKQKAEKLLLMKLEREAQFQAEMESLDQLVRASEEERYKRLCETQRILTEIHNSCEELQELRLRRRGGR